MSIHKILDYLYLGSEESADCEYIKQYNIKNVISVGVEYKNNVNQSIKLIEFYDGIKYHCIPVADEDAAPIEKYFELFSKQINYNVTHGISTLVHCGAGRSRSPSIIIGYLILYHNMTYDEAFEFVHSKRRGIRPNDGFIEKLKKLENVVKEKKE